MIGYRSGDIGYAIAPNTLVYQGRKDDQVKINGYRIELCEIEPSVVERTSGRKCGGGGD